MNGTVTFSNAATEEVMKALKMENDVRIFLPGDFEEIMKALEQEKEDNFFIVMLRSKIEYSLSPYM